MEKGWLEIINKCEGSHFGFDHYIITPLCVAGKQKIDRVMGKTWDQTELKWAPVQIMGDSAPKTEKLLE